MIGKVIKGKYSIMRGIGSGTVSTVPWPVAAISPYNAAQVVQLARWER